MALAEPSIDQFEANPMAKYLAATRPPFLLLALVAAGLGLATAYASGANINPWTALLSLLGAVVVHAGINVLNDYYDALNGTDEVNQDRLFPFTGGSRFIQNGVLSRQQMARFGWGLMCLTGLIGLLLMTAVGWGLLLLGAFGLVVGWAYSAPPLALNSRGWGELSVAVGFGWLIPLGANFVQSGYYDWSVLLLVTPFALLASALLYINQFPDVKADAQVGKDHWVVRLGPRQARWGYLIMVTLAYGWFVLVVIARGLPAIYWLGVASLPLSLIAVREVLRYAQQPQQLVQGIKATIAAVLLHGLLLTVAFCMAPN